MVGAIVVKNEEIVSTAYRGESPQCHAEFIALEKKLQADLIAGATVYTTLEPCTSRKHPKIPCAYRLIERRVKCVVIGMLDPNPNIRGKGWQLLREAGIETRMFDHDLMLQVEELNREFARLHRPSLGNSSSAVEAAPKEQQFSTDGYGWTAKFFEHEQLRDAMAEIEQSGSAYYRVIEMGPNPRGYVKSNKALCQALKMAVIWHDNHPWPTSVGLLEVILKSDGEEVQDPYTKKGCHPNGVTYCLRMDHQEQFEYVEARRDCTVTVIESGGRGFRRGQLLVDREIGLISDSLRFWAKFYASLLGPGNVADFKITWHGLKDIRLTVKDERVFNLVRTLQRSPCFCRHSSPVESELLVAAPHNEMKWHLDFLNRMSGYLFGQFDFDPPENMIQVALDGYDSDLGNSPA